MGQLLAILAHQQSPNAIVSIPEIRLHQGVTLYHVSKVDQGVAQLVGKWDIARAIPIIIQY